MRTKVACLELYSGNPEFLFFFLVNSSMILLSSAPSSFQVGFSCRISTFPFSFELFLNEQSCECSISTCRSFAPSVESLSNFYIHPSLELPRLLHFCLWADSPTWTTFSYSVSLKSSELLYLLEISPLSFIEPHFHLALCRICRAQ